MPVTQLGASEQICQPRVQLILQQHGNILEARSSQIGIRWDIAKEMCALRESTQAALVPQLSPWLERTRMANQEKGARLCVGHCTPTRSAWLFTSQGCLSKRIVSTIQMALLHMPEKCVYVARQFFSANHAVICKFGGYATTRHNHEVCDVTAA